MSMLSKNLEKSLHRAFALAGERRHEYATLEHLLLAMTEDEDAIPVLKACGVDIERLRHELETFIDNRLKGIVTQNAERAAADRGLPARAPARRHPRAVVRPQGSHRRQRAGGDVLRARQPRRVVPREPGHDAARRRQLHLPRHGQGAGPRPRPPRHAAPRRRTAARRRSSRATSRWPPTASTSTRRRREGRVDPLIGREHEVERTIQVLCRRARTTRSTSARPASARPRSPRGWRAIVEGEVPEVLKDAVDLLARHGRAARRHAGTAATSRSA